MLSKRWWRGCSVEEGIGCYPFLAEDPCLRLFSATNVSRSDLEPGKFWALSILTNRKLLTITKRVVVN